MDKPVTFATLQVVGVQHLPGRKHDHVRVFGHYPLDPNQVIREVALSPHDAVELIEYAGQHKQFPEIEVPENTVCSILNSDKIDILRLGPVDTA